MSGVLDGQKAIVTGAASGIGRAIARRLSQAGARVDICDVDGAVLSAELGGPEGLTGSACDVGNPDSVRAYFAGALERLGGLDILVNNCGIGGPKAAIEDITDEDWRRSIDVNLSGMFYCIRAAVPHLKAQGSGCIVNISTASVRTALPLRTPYIASKAGVMGLTHNVCRELGPHNIRCNTILPGLIDNPRGHAIIARHAEESGKTPAEVETEFLKYISLQTWIDPHEIGDMAVFLASSGGKHVTGQEIAVDGNVEWEI